MRFHYIYHNMVDTRILLMYSNIMSKYTITVFDHTWCLMFNDTVVLQANSRLELIAEISTMLACAVNQIPTTVNRANSESANSGLNMIFGDNSNV